ncbi:MAG: ABC transporter ATP-binding protein [Acidobacteria bacterium]|nr:ABC transporter ATP-binding protein [Acidobacteriota bacterium]
MTTVVRVERLSKDFLAGFWRPRPKRVLDDISFDIPQGVVFGLLGPNGAGKSTTLKLLLNLLRPTSGRIELLGRPAGDVEARQRLGFLPENPTFYDHLTAEELVTYFAGLFGFAGADRRRRVGEALARVGLDAERHKPLRQYSKGMLQRVGLAQAIVNDPALVVLDEPMSGLDPLGRRDVREMILEWRDQGRTVLFSSHILSDAELLCSRVGILSKGHLVASGALSDLTGHGTGGAEIVMGGLEPHVIERIRPRVRRVTRIDHGRYSLEIDATARPETIIAELAASGASLVSVTPMRTTLEDVFLKALGEAPAA